MRSLKALLVVAVTVTGCYGSIEGSGIQHGDTAAADGAPVTNKGASSTTPTGTPKSVAKTTQQAKGSCVYDAGCDGTIFATRITLTLDGKTCHGQLSEPGNGLSLGLAGDGWEMDVTSDDCGFIVEVTGMDDAAYPQTDAKTAIGPAISLFTNESLDGVDGGVGGTYQSTVSGSTVNIESGPVRGNSANIKGRATVQADGASAKHELVFEMDF